MTSEFIFDILVKYKHTKEKQEEYLKHEKEQEYTHREEKYYPREHQYVLTQVKITTNYEIGAAFLSAFKITDEINRHIDEYVKNRQKDFDYWVVPVLGRYTYEKEY